MKLATLKKGKQATIIHVASAYENDPIAHRLQELGFVEGEPIKVVAKTLGGNPMVVQIASTRFALRKKEAERIQVELSQ